MNGIPEESAAHDRGLALKRVVISVAALNLAYFFVELAVARNIGSVSLFADSIEFLEDASVNILILLAARLVAESPGGCWHLLGADLAHAGTRDALDGMAKIHDALRAFTRAAVVDGIWRARPRVHQTAAWRGGPIASGVARRIHSDAGITYRNRFMYEYRVRSVS